MLANEVFLNEFVTDLGQDHIAVDGRGVPYARASSLDALMRAAPDAAAYFNAETLADVLPQPPKNMENPSPPVPFAPFAAPVAPTLEPVKVMPIADLPDTPKPDWESEVASNVQPAGTVEELIAKAQAQRAAATGEVGTVTVTGGDDAAAVPDAPVDTPFAGSDTPDAVINTPLAEKPTDPHAVFDDPAPDLSKLN